MASSPRPVVKLPTERKPFSYYRDSTDLRDTVLTIQSRSNQRLAEIPSQLVLIIANLSPIRETKLILRAIAMKWNVSAGDLRLTMKQDSSSNNSKRDKQSKEHQLGYYNGLEYRRNRIESRPDVWSQSW
ncbi:hypothetical protein FPOAC2_10558 [Fusarium poae]